MAATMQSNVNGFRITHDESDGRAWLWCPIAEADFFSGTDYALTIFYGTHFVLCDCGNHEKAACDCLDRIDSHDSYIANACRINREICDSQEDGMGNV